MAYSGQPPDSDLRHVARPSTSTPKRKPMEHQLAPDLGHHTTSNPSPADSRTPLNLRTSAGETTLRCINGSGEKTPRSKHHHGVHLRFKERIKHFTWTWFTMTVCA